MKFGNNIYFFIVRLEFAIFALKKYLIFMEYVKIFNADI